MEKKLTNGAIDFIDDKLFHNLINNTKEDLPKIREILAKSKTKQALTLDETATLLAIKSPEAREELFDTAKELKRSIYGNRIVLFAPLYIG
ncbi:MAG: [FeFe] hydrogenase H-cluster radical SAM maturase HydG, partial [Bacteroidales bacterium]|nr:[FeFe] hydrogenase H-cluster radical SAM maturase HydG [Bacteroidales bacterium]